MAAAGSANPLPRRRWSMVYSANTKGTRQGVNVRRLRKLWAVPSCVHDGVAAAALRQNRCVLEQIRLTDLSPGGRLRQNPTVCPRTITYPRRQERKHPGGTSHVAASANTFES